MLARAQSGLGFSDVGRQVRRLFCPRGGAARQDVLLAAGAVASSDSDQDNAARVVRREVKKKGKRR